MKYAHRGNLARGGVKQSLRVVTMSAGWTRESTDICVTVAPPPVPPSGQVSDNVTSGRPSMSALNRY